MVSSLLANSADYKHFLKELIYNQQILDKQQVTHHRVFGLEEDAVLSAGVWRREGSAGATGANAAAAVPDGSCGDSGG